MTDLDDFRLDRLAPAVDTSKAHRAFVERRHQRDVRRRALVAGGFAACLLLVGLGAWAVTRSDDAVSVDTGPAATTDTEPAPAGLFHVLAMDQADEPAGTLRAATDAPSLRTLWTEVGFDGGPPEVDLDTFVVVSMTVPGNICSSNLVNFGKAVDEASGLQQWTPEFVHELNCKAALTTKTFVVALNRTFLDPTFVLRLPPAESPQYYTGEPRLTVHLEQVSSDAALPAPAFEVLLVQRPVEQEQGGTLRAATDAATLTLLWEKAGLQGAPPDVDFDRSVVVSMVIPEPACRPTLTGFARDDDVLVPQFEENAGLCLPPSDSLSETFVIVIERTTLGPMLTVRLPARTETPLYRGQPSIDVILDQSAARAAGLIPPECIESDGASVCLEESTDDERVVLHATNLAPGGTFDFTYPSGELSAIPSLGGEVSTHFVRPGPGTMLRVHVAATTAAGRPIEGTIAFVG